ncbi:MAG: hypothetical protein EBR34_09450 [Sphingomonadaceae bacterium]|nr:hypothetical protein [Sphingomonadaceae bacterium]
MTITCSHCKAENPEGTVRCHFCNYGINDIDLPDSVGGWTLVVLGLLTSISAFFFYDTVLPLSPAEEIAGATTIHNVGLLQNQLMLFLGGCMAALIGSIWLAALSIKSALAK